MLYKLVLTFESLDDILKGDLHSNGSVVYIVLSRGAVYCSVQGRWSNFWACGWNPEVLLLKWKLLSSTFLWRCLFPTLKVFFQVEKIVNIFSYTEEVISNQQCERKGRKKENNKNKQKVDSYTHTTWCILDRDFGPLVPMRGTAANHRMSWSWSAPVHSGHTWTELCHWCCFQLWWSDK